MKAESLLPNGHSRDAVVPIRIPQRNNFDLLRFAFAMIVLLVHAYQLSGSPALAVLGEVFSSEIAVRSFFVVSGFLIFMSYENSRSDLSYFAKRIRRIYPAYFTVIVLLALLGAGVSTLSAGDYYSSGLLLKYLAANLLFLNFLQQNLPGVFPDNTYQAVNGALWTLKIEVMFYLCVPIIVWASRRFGRGRVLALLYVGAMAYSWIFAELARLHGGMYVELQRQLPGQMGYFIAGAALYYYFPRFKTCGIWGGIVGLVGLIAVREWGLYFLEPVMLGAVVTAAALVYPYWGNFGKYGDFSYGVYIVHFPVLQALIYFGVFRIDPWGGLIMAISIVMIAAFLLWHGVEKRFLRKSSHYLNASH
jgi:peptidoglycan/LPS O-acetylase OafA/YrhL